MKKRVAKKRNNRAIREMAIRAGIRHPRKNWSKVLLWVRVAEKAADIIRNQIREPSFGSLWCAEIERMKREHQERKGQDD